MSDHLTQMMGLGAPGEVREGPDGQLYGWVEATDGLGNPIGFWKRIRRLAKRAVNVAAQYHPAARAVQQAAQGAGLLGDVDEALGLGQPGEVVEGPDGQLYGWVEATDGLGNPIGFWKRIRRLARRAVNVAAQVHPGARALQTAAQGAGLLGAADDELTQIIGLGEPGELREGPDGQLYGWVEAYDGLGSPIGFWKRIKRFARKAVRTVRNVARQAAPIVSSFVPGAAPVVAAARAAGVLGDDSDPAYPIEGLADDEAAAYDPAMHDPGVEGLEDDEAGMEGYIREDGVQGYVKEQPDGTRWFVQSTRRPTMWAKPW